MLHKNLIGPLGGGGVMPKFKVKFICRSADGPLKDRLPR